MTTSGTALWTPDITELVEEAFERAGVEIRTGYQFRTARRSLNILFAEWANRGINLWTVTEVQLALTAGVYEYPMPQDTVDIIEHVIRQNPGSEFTQVDLQITRIALPTYSTIPNKLSQGRPIQIYIDRLAPIPVMKLWPVPDNSSPWYLNYWYLRRIQDAGASGTNTTDMPFRFYPAIIAGLAYHLALKSVETMNSPNGAARLQWLKQMYDEAFDQAASEDRDKSSVRFIPRVGYIGRGA
jgi:hypothetical protein